MLKNSTPRSQPIFGLERISALSDGVIAIAITILVLGIDIPENHDFTEQGLMNFLGKLEPSLIAYTTSFILIAMYWMQQHTIFKVLKGANQYVLWINMLFLFAISLAPFLDKVKTLYGFDADVIMLFAAINIFTGIVLFGMWRYIIKHPELLKSPVSEAASKNISMQLLIIPAICLLAIPIGYIAPKIGTHVFSFVLVLYILIRKIDPEQEAVPDK